MCSTRAAGRLAAIYPGRGKRWEDIKPCLDGESREGMEEREVGDKRQSVAVRANEREGNARNKMEKKEG